jgi:hypothetical protein
MCLKDKIAGCAAILEGHELMRDIAQCAVPVIALVEGMALGGGYELALACDGIIAKEGAVVGLPEKKLGILPGWGGTQRLTRRVGLENAVWMILNGEQKKVDTPWVDIVLKKDEFVDWILLELDAQAFEKRKFGPLTYSISQNLWYAKKLLKTKLNIKYQNEPPSKALALHAIWNGNKRELALGLGDEFEAVFAAFQTQEAVHGIRHFLATGDHLYKNEK